MKNHNILYYYLTIQYQGVCFRRNFAWYIKGIIFVFVYPGLSNYMHCKILLSATISCPFLSNLLLFSSNIISSNTLASFGEPRIS